MPDIRFDRKPDVLAIRGDRNTNLYSDIKKGEWPPPIKLGRCSVWLHHENQTLLRAIVAGASAEQRRQIVRDLLEQRKALMPAIGATEAA